MKKSQQTALWILAVVVVIVAVVLLTKNKSEQNTENSYSPNPSGSVSISPTPKTGNKVTPTSQGKITYDQAVVQYAGSRIQFNDVCQPISSINVIKKGNNILLDNRSKYEQTIKVGSSTYKLPAYGWQVVNVTTTQSLPFNSNVSCTSSNGSGSMVLQIQANIIQGI
jgi:hypothetical protein